MIFWLVRTARGLRVVPDASASVWKRLLAFLLRIKGPYPTLEAARRAAKK